jgi:pimeloyl-ACP methyl ester carboxylesterase
MKTRYPGLLRILSLGATLTILSACGGNSSGNADAAGGAAKLALKPCRVKGVENEVKCATFEVIENRETNQGRKIGINVVVLPALARAKEPDPIFLFAGGPGQASGDLAQQALAMLDGLNNKRDIVLIDQRGTGKSNLLNCKMPEPTDADMADPAKRDAKTKKLITECRDELAKRADLTQYTTTIAMADYNEVRAALGYDKINLFGASYGTRSSMEYLRRYPDRVRSVTIDGVAPPSMALPALFSRDAGAAYDKIFSDCAKDAACTARFPTLKADVDALLATLGGSPKKVKVTHPVTGVSKEIDVTRDSALTAIFSTLYVPELAAMLPSMLMQARAGDFSPLLSMGSMFGDFAEDRIAFGMRLSVMCVEDLPRVTPAMIDAEAKRAPFGRLFIDEFAKACEVWPKGKMAAGFETPVKSDKPVLILSGGLDPVTPPVHGDEVKVSLANALHLVAPNVGHGVTHRGCGPKLVKKFIETASVAGLDGACLQRLPRPLFYEPLREKKTENAAPKVLNEIDKSSDKNTNKNGERK